MQTAEGRETQARMRTEEREIEAREKEEKKKPGKRASGWNQCSNIHKGKVYRTCLIRLSGEDTF